MIEDRTLRRIAAERNLRLDLIEKDYALGWMIIAISKSSLKDKLIFKGGTALSKVYFPLNWRISEDLDFTLSGNAAIKDVPTILLDELPGIAEELNGLTLEFKNKPFLNPDFLRSRVQFTGPISKNTIKIEVTVENFIGEFDKIQVPPTYDYPEFGIVTYSLNNIIAEKFRSLIERTKIRDYYDLWRLLNMNEADTKLVKTLFLKKCEGKGIVFQNVNQFFPEDVAETLEPYLPNLIRLTSEPLPSLTKMIEELRKKSESLMQ
jgi:hypothetical protein